MARGYFRNDCRLCHSNKLECFLDFGMHPHSDGFLKKEQLNEPEPFFPLACNVCTDCGHVQLSYVVSPNHLYNSDYVYDGSITETGRNHYKSFAYDTVNRFRVNSNELIIDIGSNVGFLLSEFKENGMRVLGIDPAIEPTKLAKERGIETDVRCFSSELAKEVKAKHGSAKVITGTNVFAHIDNLDDFMYGIEILLSENGVLVLESPYIADLINHLEYDTIYHQHLSYLAIKPLTIFFNRFGMDLFDVEQTDIHGGSIRLFVCRKGIHSISEAVGKLCKNENKSGLYTFEKLKEFSKKVEAHRLTIIKMLVDLHDAGKTIYGIGAPAKGMTLLNYCGIHKDLMPYLTEKCVWKHDKFAPGVHIPIVSDTKLLEDQPDYALILPWNFGKEIMQNLHQYKANGGNFILPIPSPSLI